MILIQITFFEQLTIGDLLKKQINTLVLASAPVTRVIGLMPSALGMKRIRAVTVDLGRDAACAGLSSSI